MEPYSKPHFHYEFAKSFHWRYFIYKISLFFVFFFVSVFLYLADKGTGGLIFLGVCFCASVVLFFMSFVFLFCFLFLKRFLFPFVEYSWYRSSVLSYFEDCKKTLLNKDGLSLKKIRKKMPFVNLTDENIQDAEQFISYFLNTHLYIVSNSKESVEELGEYLGDEPR